MWERWRGGWLKAGRGGTGRRAGVRLRNFAGTKPRGPGTGGFGSRRVWARHPEKVILEAMREAEAGPDEGAQMESFYREVVGSHPAGLAAAEEKRGRRGRVSDD